jgi:hypothetical protein
MMIRLMSPAWIIGLHVLAEFSSSDGLIVRCLRMCLVD